MEKVVTKTIIYNVILCVLYNNNSNKLSIFLIMWKMNGDNLVILSYYIENHVKLKGLAEININIQALHHFGLTP
jgi:hypothetical protein